MNSELKWVETKDKKPIEEHQDKEILATNGKNWWKERFDVKTGRYQVIPMSVAHTVTHTAIVDFPKVEEK